MSEKQKWPRWIALRYYRETDGSIMGYTASAHNLDMLFERFEQLNLLKSNVITIAINGETLSEDEIKKLFYWIDGVRREREEIMKNGKRPSVKQKTIIAAANLNHNDWLVVKNLTTELHLVNRHTKKQKVVQV